MRSTLLCVLLLAVALCGAHAIAFAPNANITMLTTSYGWNDNSPPSADIAFPKGSGHPTIHSVATEGNGSYADPITFATDQKEFAPGTYVYVVHLRKYFIMEDECDECDADWNKGKYHIDLWMGPDKASPEPALDNCEAKITRDKAVVIVNPDRNLPVEYTKLFINGECTAKIY